jgi:3-deoxy-manno-octulosonate cytidylyltransferase (CMP-KDO synthetase)
MSDPLVLIPARMQATRLPGKPLVEIAGTPMIVHVWRRAVAAGIGPVAVATDSVPIMQVIEQAGGIAIMTRAEHESGSDRIFEAAEILDPHHHHDVIVNVQGDLPTINPHIIAESILPLTDREIDCSTLCALIDREEEKTNPNVVKIIASPLSPQHFKALYFTRATAPWGNGPLYHHIGLYAWRRSSLERFVSLSPSALEQRERLEQLRALEAGMRIDARLVEDVPLGVDSPKDLERARKILA